MSSDDEITFTENGTVSATQLNALYRLIGWDSSNQRDEARTLEMLKVSRYYIAAQSADGELVGFARVAGDPYVAQVLDVITHPNYRRRGVASACMRAVVAHLRVAHYVSVTLTDGSGLERFYEQFGFRPFQDIARIWRPGESA